MQGGNLVKAINNGKRNLTASKAGRKAIKILAPSPFTVKKQVEKSTRTPKSLFSIRTENLFTEEKGNQDTRLSCVICL